MLSVLLLYFRLDRHNLIEDTFIIFTTDHGYHFGEWTLNSAKATAYDTDVHIPLLVRGPGVAKGSSTEEPVSLIDIAPSMMEIAEIKQPQNMDGKSFLKHITNWSSRKRGKFRGFSNLLVEYTGVYLPKTIDSKCKKRFKEMGKSVVGMAHCYWPHCDCAVRSLSQNIDLRHTFRRL